MELTRCCLVQGSSLGMGRLHAMRWSSVTLSAILGKVVSRSLPNPSLPPCTVRISYHSINPIFFPLLKECNGVVGRHVQLS